VSSPYRILETKHRGLRLSRDEIRQVVDGATDGSWDDAQLASFLTSAFIRGLDEGETEALTLAMLESGERWDLASEIPTVVDKHSTGGVGDKVSLLLCPLLAACGIPVAMLTGRGLGHTAGTADKLESLPGLDQNLDRGRVLDLLEQVGMAIGMATSDIAPADRRLYSIRDVTATIESIPFITSSILSKKLAMGAAGLVFDVKTGNGAFMAEEQQARELAERLVAVALGLDRKAAALVTDMSQPLGRWVGHAAEVKEVWECLGGEGAPDDLLTVTFALCREVTALVGEPKTDGHLRTALESGRAHEAFVAWAEAQGTDPAWLAAPELPLAPAEHVLASPRSGRLARVETRQIGLLLAESGGGRKQVGDSIDHGVALWVSARLGERVEVGEELARLYLRREDEDAAQRMAACFEIGDVEQGGQDAAPELIRDAVRV
jgi:pyrimidine-nucleoside phosphorylase